MKKVFLYVHSHWDREWYREFEEFRLRLIEVIDDVFAKLSSGEFPCFYFDGQTAALEDYLAIYPEKESLVKKFIEEKKLFIGPFYCSSDSFLVSAEFMLRNLSIGMTYSQKMGCNDFIGYLADSFGHSSAVPAVLKSSGIDKAMLWRGLGDLPSEFNWQGIGVTYLIQGYFQDILSMDVAHDKKALFLEKFIDKIAERSSDNILLPCGADHLKVPNDLAFQVKEINRYLEKYELKLSNPFEYLEAVKDNYKSDVDGEFLNETKSFLLKGVYSSRIYQKKVNALCQWSLSRVCEPAATICHTLGVSKNWQKEMDYAYKTLIQNHAHDSIYGCSTDEVHKDVDRRFVHVQQVTNGVKKRLIRDLSEESRELRFLNLSNHPYTGTVEVVTDKEMPTRYYSQVTYVTKGFSDKKLYDPTQIPMAENVRTIKKYLVEVKDLKPFAISEGKINGVRKHKITEKSIENDYIKLYIRFNRISMWDKVNKKFYKDVLEIIDRADVGDSYNFGPFRRDKAINAKIVSSRAFTEGKILSTLRIVWEISIPYLTNPSAKKRCISESKHFINMEVSLSNVSNYIDFKFEWDNKSNDHLLQVKFNLDNPVDTTYSEDMLKIVERKFDPNYNIYEHIPAPRGVELKTNTAPMQRFVWAQGLGIVTKGLHEYEVSKNSLLLTILRSTGFISQVSNPSRGTPAGPPIKCNDLQCMGRNTAEFRLAFTDSPRDLYALADGFYGCVVPFFGNLEMTPFFKVSNDKIHSIAIKTDDEGNVIFRFVNTSDKKETFKFFPPSGYEKVFVVDLLENIIEPAKEKVSVESGEIITLKCTKK